MYAAPWQSVVLFLLASVLGALGQFLYKSASERSDGIVGSLLSLHGVLGVLCYVAVMLLFMAAFKRGGSVAVLYPIYATTFVWAMLIAWMRLGEPIRWPNVLGVLLLAAGVFLLGVRPVEATGDDSTGGDAGARGEAVR